ncbi:MAG: dihydrofolate reductase [Arcticibacterium sp.]|jgi:dihydrofolate reductase
MRSIFDKYFMNTKLVDEVQLAITPILIGVGKPLFSGLG